MKRYAAALLLLPDGTFTSASIVETEQGNVVRYYPLEIELHSTFWLEGIICIEKQEESLTATQLTPYDMINKKPVAETRRIPLP